MDLSKVVIMKKHHAVLAIIGLFACLSQFAIDIYIPSLPAMALHFCVTKDYVQWSVTVYAVALALSMLVYGPLSEVFGRRKPLLFGLCLFLIGSLMCALSRSMPVLVLGRLVQGLGGGAVAVLWRAIMRDLFTGDELAQYSSYLTPLIVGIMALAPLLGGYFQHYFSWSASFLFLFFYALACIGLVFYYYEETHQDRSKAPFHFYGVMGSFAAILSNRIFIAYAATVCLAFAAYFCWFIMGPFIVMHVLGLSSIQFGWINSMALLVMAPLGSMLNARFVKRIKGYNMICIGFSMLIVSGLILLASSFFFHLTLVAVVLAILLVNFGLSFIWVNASSGAMTPFGHAAGYAATLYAFIQYGGGGLIASLLAAMPDHAATPLGLAWVLIPLLGIAVVRWGVVRVTSG
jgi:Bcr/CflA subfamily drug resistance transporter